MKHSQRTAAPLGLAALALTLIAAQPGLGLQTQEGAVVHAVLFYSPTCPYCEIAINDVLPALYQTYSPEASLALYPPLQEGEEQPNIELALVYGGQLEILYVNVTPPSGYDLYAASYDSHPVPDDQRGVPRLVVGEAVLVGPQKILDELPGIIDRGLAEGGIDWPDIPGLADALGHFADLLAPTVEATSQPTGTEAIEPTAAPTMASTTAPTAASTAAPTPAHALVSLPTEQPATVLDRIQRDPVGNGLAIVVLLGMIGSIVVVVIRFLQPSPYRALAWQVWAYPVLCLVGAGVAAYLTYVETSGATAVCGPVGDCNTVQQSQYARLFGILPIGALGLAAYLLMLITWLLGRAQSGRYADWAAVANFGMAAIGTVFSIGLTFLEPFVIGATCAWCLTSAVVITALLWLASGPGTAAVARLEAKGAEETEEPQ